MGGCGKAITLGLGLRHDWGSQYRAKQFQADIGWLGIRSTPAYVREPECSSSATTTAGFSSGNGYMTPARAREKLSRRAA